MNQTVTVSELDCSAHPQTFKILLPHDTHLGARGRGERSHVVREARAGGKQVVDSRRENLVRGGFTHAQDVPQVFNLIV